MFDYLARARYKLKEILLTSDISASNVPICFTTSTTGFGGTRYWFACPVCSRRAGVLFIHPLSHQVGCRTCLGLSYRKQRYKGMAETL
jgi:hypothetical protein